MTYNNEATIDACLESLTSQTYPDFDISIFDNNSADSTILKIANRKNLSLIKSPQNLGFAAAVNHLAKNAIGNYLFILNPDCQCPRHALSELVAFAQTHSGAISAALINPAGIDQPSARDLPNYRNILFSRKSPLYALGLSQTSDAGYLNLEMRCKVPAVSATALFISTPLFKEIGGFDERFFMFLEDIDLCRRLGNNNIDIWFLPDIKIIHSHGASSAGRSLKPLYYHYASMYKYFLKNYPDAVLKNLALLILLLGGFVISSILRLLGVRAKT